MAEEFITRDEHEEFCRRMESENKRLEDENNRQNQRIKNLEKSTEQVQLIISSVEKLAMSVDNMAKELGKQGERLEALEEVPGKNWDTLKTGILGAVAAAIGGGMVAATINFM
jgi:hypothetical protein